MARKSVNGNKSRMNIHSVAKLKMASDYLEYSIHTLTEGIDIYYQSPDKFVRNAAVDSILLRSRVLIDFFMNADGRSDDILAVDFFDEPEDKPYVPYLSPEVEVERDRINKYLMHLTIKPMPDLVSDQGYPLNKIIPPIIDAFRKWLSSVSDSRLQDPAVITRRIFEEHLARLERQLPVMTTSTNFQRFKLTTLSEEDGKIYPSS